MELNMKFRIENMTCGGCARSVTATIKDLDENATVNIDVATKLVEVESTVNESEIVAALTEDGFPPVAA
jgi:copper chaperone